MMKNPVHPGEILREEVLADLTSSLSEVASRLAVSPVVLIRVMNGQAPISRHLAVGLEEVGVSTARAWLDMQTAYDLSLQRTAAVQ